MDTAIPSKPRNASYQPSRTDAWLLIATFALWVVTFVSLAPLLGAGGPPPTPSTAEEAVRQYQNARAGNLIIILLGLAAMLVGIVPLVRIGRQLLMDINMPGLNGLLATQRILHSSPHIAVLILTMFDDDDSVFAAMRSGARGYLLKGALKAEILRAIRAVGSGEIIFGAAIAARMMRFFAQYQPTPPAFFPELTGREHQILALMSRHMSNQDIAAQLGLSDKTIRNNVSNILSKLQVIDRAQAILKARDAGLS